MKTFSFKYYLLLFTLIGSILSCDKDEPQVIGVEVSGTSSLNGTYMIDQNYTKGTRFINKENDTERIKTYTSEEGVDMWGLMRRNVLYYKIERDGSNIPPESQWECGIGVDKDKFKCLPIFGSL
ncbi:hypothetical protein [Cognatitamlana onchidii]|uniref:hypothetical protein n=1 Tax=Cognatitamlana onchidii TaxID=2562860 RepID=UPI0010A63A21|nr:hypothetical protein [Algibacter onchidii]